MPLTLLVEIVHRRSHIHRNLKLVPETVGENQRELISVGLDKNCTKVVTVFIQV